MKSQHRRNRWLYLSYLTILGVLFFTAWLSPVTAVAADTSLLSDRSAQLSDHALTAFLKENMGSEQESLDIYDAEVWLKTMLGQMAIYNIEKKESLKILNAAYREASRANIPPDLVLAVIAIESSFNRFAVSSAGALGLMQVMPFWKDEIGRGSDNLVDININIRYGCKILQYYWQQSNANMSTALARYNGSYRKNRKSFSYSEKVVEEWIRNWRFGNVTRTTQ